MKSCMILTAIPMNCTISHESTARTVVPTFRVRSGRCFMRRNPKPRGMVRRERSRRVQHATRERRQIDGRRGRRRAQGRMKSIPRARTLHSKSEVPAFFQRKGAAPDWGNAPPSSFQGDAACRHASAAAVGQSPRRNAARASKRREAGVGVKRVAEQGVTHRAGITGADASRQAR